ncbi:hypothetical protein IJ670_06410 [bacterium]|nr:hypothetical protein [bacterium]
MSELGIFIDESGNFEKNNSVSNNLSDLYIVSFLFHDKSLSIDNGIKNFEDFLLRIGIDKHFPIHTMPLIRKQKPYNIFNEEFRRKLFYRLFVLMCKLKLKHKTFVCDKKFCTSKKIIRQRLAQYIRQMVADNHDYFNKFDEIVIYYDEGQDYLTKILHDAFSINLKNYRFKESVCQEDYRLSQCADMVCTLELINQRKQNGEHIKAIDNFFISDNKYNKNYAKAYKNLEL